MAGYSRQSAASIVPTAVVRATPLNNEFNTLRDAFAHVGGHRHDGSGTEGGYIPLIADVAGLTKIAVDSANNRLGVFVNVSGVSTEQFRVVNGAIVPVTDNVLDLGSAASEFKDLYIDGVANIDSLVADSVSILGGSINGTAIGATTPSTGAFTTASASGGFTGNLIGNVTGNVSGTAANVTGVVAVANGGTGVTSSTGTGSVVLSASPTFTGTVNAAALTLSGAATLSSGTANGIAYLNGSKVLTTGSALSFNGTSLTIGSGSGNPFARINGGTIAGQGGGYAIDRNGTEIGGVYSGSWYTSGSAAVNTVALGTTTAEALLFGINYTEQMRLTSTGLSIGASSPAFKLDVRGSSGTGISFIETSSGNSNRVQLGTGAGFGFINADAGAGSISLALQVSGSTKATLDSSGNLGLGVTPSAWASSRALQIGSSLAPYMGLAQMTTGTADGYMLWGAYLTGNRTFAYTTTGDPPAAYRQVAGTHAWLTAPSGTAGNPISFTQVASITNGGNLLVGTTVDSGPRVAIHASSPVLRLQETASGGDKRLELSVVGADAIIGANQSAQSLVFQTIGTERARIDSSGNLGLGVTPSAWSVRTIQVPNNYAFGHLGVSNNAFYDGAWKYITTAAATVTTGTGGSFTWNIAPSGTAGNPISFTQAMTLTQGGNQLVGTTSDTGHRLVVVSANSASQLAARFNGTDGTNSAVFDIAGSGIDPVLEAVGARNLLFRANNTERARITSGGNLLVGTTSDYRNGRLVVKDVNRSQTSTTANLHVSTTDAQGADIGGSIGLGGLIGGDETPFAFISGRKENGLNGNYQGYLAFATQDGAAAVGERARITSGGNLLVGTTTNTYSSKIVSNDGITDFGSQYNVNLSGADYQFVQRGANRGFAFYVNAAGTIATLSSAGVWTDASDARYKENVQPTRYGLDAVMQLKPREYNLIGQSKKQVGFIAQEVLDVVPEVVDYVVNSITNEDRYTLSYGQMTAVLTKAIQELKAQNDELRARVAALETK